MSKPLEMRIIIPQAWTPGRFLFAGSMALLTIGGAGLAGLLGRISPASFFHPPVWIDRLHLMVGALALGAAALASRTVKLALTLIPAVVATGLGVGGLIRATTIAGGQLGLATADTSDALVHLAVGALALLATWNGLRAKSTGLHS